jgi:hypothetical protein
MYHASGAFILCAVYAARERFIYAMDVVILFAAHISGLRRPA